MQLSYAQTQYISKQYLKYLDGKLKLDKFNTNLQKFFNVGVDFRSVIKDCVKRNKGSYDIGWVLYDLEEVNNENH
ncbi:hypothetical protein [Paenibacillus tianjinensis]|uniref:Uncharacterized protein n=1 Tax=Paenibacillus tianjinensis TaxID=2810347 RepID=A0ABX7L5S3_9BACL|nr:hypothetical protein [Paenibacillus tianjinensis]QSF43452.1 hypothetical protein JRJ22_19505 [Paenibacillus tianjinensis]